MKRLDAASAQVLWREMFWCGTRPQLREVGEKIRREYAATPEQRQANAKELASLRRGYDARWSMLYDDPR